jgi:hypothetical protein
MTRIAGDGRDPSGARATLGPSADPRYGSPPSVRATYRRLTARGLNGVEAGNLTAFLNGLAPVMGGWDVDEIERLLFVLHLVERGRLRS